MLLARLAGAIALVAIVVAIGVSLHEPRGTIVIQAPGPTNQDDDNGGTFLPDGGTFLQGEGPFTGQPRVNPPPVRNAGSRDFPGWRLPSLFPSWDEVRGFLVPRAPACDDRHDMPKLFRSEAFIARYPRTADSSTSPDTVIVGDAIPLCVPRDIAVGPEGELYVLDFYRRPSDDVPGARALVTVYDGDGDRDNEPIRVFSVAADAIAIAVDSTGHFWISSRSAGGVVRVYGPGVKGQTEPARRIAGWGTEASAVLGIGVDSRGNSYVISGDEVVVYPAGARDDDVPLRRIGGPDTFLRSPADLAIGPGDTLYVLNAVGSWGCHGRRMPKETEVAVTIYPPSADGNVKPARQIVVMQMGKGPGPIGLLTRPTGLTVDRAGAVYVASEMAGQIAVFAPGASGMVAPSRILHLRGAAGEPKAFAIGKDGALYVLGFPGPGACF
jgi:sugar lactone lactonase YvrE